MADILKMNRDKEKILSTIRIRGPSLPVQISKNTNMSPLFASAFLSELRGEEKLKISDMKVGSSPLYYAPGQENMLENFVQHLNQKERQAFNILKARKVLDDSNLEPVVRVALRYIKDFAIPIKVKYNNEEKLFWKYFVLEDGEFESIAKSILEGKERYQEGRKIDLGEINKEIIEEKKEEVVKNEIIDKYTDKDKLIEKAIEEGKNFVSDKKKREHKIKKRDYKKETVEGKKEDISIKKDKVLESEFGRRVREYLFKKDIAVLEMIIDKKKEVIAKIRTNHIFGEQIHYLIAKDKKNISDNDLAVALQNAQAEKMPAIVMSTGDLNKKGKEYISQWNNLVKFKKMEF